MAVPKTKQKTTGAKKSAAGKPGRLASAIQYLRDVRVEFRKVIWPDRTEVSSSVVVVLVTLAFFITLIGLIDLFFSQLIRVVLPSFGG